MGADSDSKLYEVPVQEVISSYGARIADVVSVDKNGRILVDVPGSPFGPIPALALSHVLDSLDLIEGCNGQRVLVVFESNDLRSPIIVGVMRDPRILFAPLEREITSSPRIIIFPSFRSVILLLPQLNTISSLASILTWRPSIKASEIPASLSSAYS